MDAPARRFSITLVGTLSAFIFLIGLATILSLTHTRLPEEFLDLIPRELFRVSRSLMLVTGLILILLSQQLRLRKRSALFATLAVLAVGIVLDTVLLRSPLQSLVYLLAFVLLADNQRQFMARFNDVDMKRGLWNSLLLLLAGLLYGTIGFYAFRFKLLGHERNTILDAFRMAADQILTFSRSNVLPVGRTARWFTDSLQLVSISTAVLAASALFYPIRFLLNATGEDLRRARAILKRSSTSTEDFFKLWPLDKHYVFSTAGNAFVAYKVARGVAMVLDGPSGEPAEFPELCSRFLQFAAENGWRSAVIHADEATVALFEPLGLSATYVGGEALVNIATFLEQTTRSKHFRYVANRAARDGLTTELWQHPLSPARLRVLHRISDAWVAGGRSEFTFTMAPFSDEYLSGCDVAVVLHTNRPIAYVNLLPSFGSAERTVDHMRAYPSAPSVTMHFLFLELLRILHEEGAISFNLGFSPLSGLESLPEFSRTERLLSVLKRMGSRVYSFEGVESFKRKFDPLWEPRYFMYQDGLIGLLQLARAVSAAIKVPPPPGRRLTLPEILGISAAICYLSFILAPLLIANVPPIVSELGAHGQPYSHFFDGADILSGLLTWSACYVLLERRSHASRIRFASLVCLALGALGTVLAAMVELPATGDYRHILSVKFLHIAFSTLDVGGTLASACLLTWYLRRGLPARLAGGMALLLAISDFSFLLVSRFPALAGDVERATIVLGALWLALFPALTSRT